jgi:hypothetical protein
MLVLIDGLNNDADMIEVEYVDIPPWGRDVPNVFVYLDCVRGGDPSVKSVTTLQYMQTQLRTHQ